MSFSKPKLTNPAKKFISWRSKDQGWFYYDKEVGEKGQNVQIKTPAYFIILDRLHTVTGFTNGRDGSGIFSNEVHDLNREKLTVRSFDDFVHIKGFWHEIKDTVKSAGGKYAQSVYAVKVSADTEPELVNLKFSGASRDPYFSHNFKEQDIIILTPEFTQAENGGTAYNIPEIKKGRMTEEQRTKFYDFCFETDVALQKYLESRRKEYLEEIVDVKEDDDSFSVAQDAINNANKSAEQSDSPPVPEEFPDDLPF